MSDGLANIIPWFMSTIPLPASLCWSLACAVGESISSKKNVSSVSESEGACSMEIQIDLTCQRRMKLNSNTSFTNIILGIDAMS